MTVDLQGKVCSVSAGGKAGGNPAYTLCFRQGGGIIDSKEKRYSLAVY